MIKEEEETITPPKKSTSPPQPIVSSPWQRATYKKTTPTVQTEEAVLPLTKQETIAQEGKNWVFGLHEYIQQRQVIAGQKGRIIPEGLYVMQEEGPSWSKGQILTGSQVITQYENIQDINKKGSLDYLKGTGRIIKQVEGLPSGTLFYPEEKGLVVALPESQSMLSFYKSKGYVSPGGDIGFYKNPPQPSAVLSQIKGTPASKIIIGSESVMNLGFPFLYAGVAQGLTGQPAIERQYQEYAFRGVQSLPGQEESIPGNLLKNLTSQEVVFDVYLPVAMLGVGAAMKPLLSPAISRVSNRLAGINTAKMIGGKYVKMSALGVAKVVGVGAMASLPVFVVGSTAVQNPEALPSVLGHLTSQVVVAGASFKLGEMSYESPPIVARESRWSLTGRMYSVPELQGKILTKTYALRGVENPDEIFSHSTVVNWPGRNVQSIGISNPFKQTDIEVMGRSESGVMTKKVTSNYNEYTSIMFDEDKINVASGFSRGRAVKDILKGDFLVSRSQGFTYANEEIGFYRGTHVQQSFYEGDTIIKDGFLSQRKDTFTMVYSRILPKKGLILDVAKVSGGPDLSTSSVITKNIIEYVPPSSGFEIGGGFPSIIMRGKGYAGAFPSMYSRVSFSVLGDMEYVIQSSGKWSSSVPRVDVLSRTKLKSLSSLVSLNVFLMESQNQNVGIINSSRSIQKQLNLNVSKQLNVQISNQQSLQVPLQNILTDQVNILGVQEVPILSLIEQPVSTNTIYPVMPLVPLGSLTGGVGGGYGRARRRKKGSRYRVHPVRLYNVLYLNKEIAI